MSTELELKRHPETGELIEEEWSGLSGYDEWYDVSNYGRVRSWKNHASRPGRREKPKLMSYSFNQDGYPCLWLYREDKQIYNGIHRLVATEFVENDCPEYKVEVNHKDCDKSNNFYLNLEWCTHAENMRHARDNGLVPTNKGESNGSSKLTEKDILDIKNLYKSGKHYQYELAEMYGVTQPAISSIVSKKTWSHV